MTTRIFRRGGHDASNWSVMGVTHNERAWIEFIRLISDDTDPAPTLARIQRLRQILTANSQSRTR
jgi:hypothetical protein